MNAAHRLGIKACNPPISARKAIQCKALVRSQAKDRDVPISPVQASQVDPIVKEESRETVPPMITTATVEHINKECGSEEAMDCQT